MTETQSTWDFQYNGKIFFSISIKLMEINDKSPAIRLVLEITKGSMKISKCDSHPKYYSTCCAAHITAHKKEAFRQDFFSKC